jgi:hypothetical protein
MIEDQHKILIIAGMHRSGTSVVSNWLHKCNLNIGDNLLGADIGNADGHFEDIDFYRYHEDVLQDNHLSKFGYVNRPIQNLSYYQEEKIKSITSFKSKVHKQWGWKEPRTCLFLNHYRKLIPEAYYLVVLRDYHSTVNSLIVRDFKYVEAKYLARNWFSKLVWKKLRRQRRKQELYKNLTAYYLNVWITYSRELLKHLEIISEEKFLAVDYNLLNCSDKETFAVLTDKWRFSLKYFDFKKVFKEKLISRVIDIDEFVADRSLLKTAKELEDKLKAYV